MPRIKTVLSPAWTTDWMTEQGKQKLAAYGIAPPARQGVAPGFVRRGACHLSALSFARYATHFRIRLDRLQGAVALRACAEPFDYFKCI